MLEERRNAIYLTTRRKHAIDIQDYERQPWVQNIDGTWSRMSSIENMTMTISEDGIRFHNNRGFNELYS